MAKRSGCARAWWRVRSPIVAMSTRPSTLSMASLPKVIAKGRFNGLSLLARLFVRLHVFGPFIARLVRKCRLGPKRDDADFVQREDLARRIARGLTSGPCGGR